MSFEKLIKNMIHDQLRNALVCFPGIIDSYDAQKNTASVQPLLRTQSDKGPVPYGVIPDVPIMISAGGGYYIRVPFQKGDMVQLAFSAFDIHRAMEGSATDESEDIFNAANCFINGGLRKKTAPSFPGVPTEDGILIGHESGYYMSIRNDVFKFYFDNQDEVEINKDDGVKATLAGVSYKLIHQHPFTNAYGSPSVTEDQNPAI